MEDVKKLGEMALKLENYRYRIILSLSWVIFGMLFASTTLYCLSLQILGLSAWVWLILLPTGIVGSILYRKFLKLTPIEKRKSKAGILLLTLPFFLFYSIFPLILSLRPFYYSIAWYPSLGLGLLLYGLYVKERTTKYAGITMLLTSPFFLLLPNSPLIGSLIGIATTLLIYLSCFLYSFFKAQESLYA